MRLCLLFAFAAAACATAPRPHEVQRSETIDADVDTTWAALISLFGERGWPIATLDKGSGMIATDWLKMPDGYADCGSAPLAHIVGTKGRFNIIARSVDDGTRITVNAKFQQVRTLGDVAGVVDCTSTGGVETQIHGWVEERTRRAKAE